MDLKEIEYLHDTGRMPDWAYYQLNGKNAQENYVAIKKKQHAEWLNQMKAKQNLSHQIETQMEPVLNAVLDDLLKDLV